MTVTSSPAGEHAGTKPLTRRQREILLLAANGCTDDQIARRLGLIRYTVNRHLCNTYQALGAHGRANAVAIAIAVGELDTHDINIPDRQHRVAA